MASKLVAEKLGFCNYMAALLEGLDTDTAKAFIQWLDKFNFDCDSHHFESWQEEAEFIYCTED